MELSINIDEQTNLVHFLNFKPAVGSVNRIMTVDLGRIPGNSWWVHLCVSLYSRVCVSRNNAWRYLRIRTNLNGPLMIRHQLAV